MSDNPIQQSELWEITQRLVSFNTVSAASNVEAAEYLATFLERIIHEWCITREELVLRGR